MSERTVAERTAVQRLVAVLRDFEHAQDRAFSLGGQVQAALVAAQSEACLAPGVAQPAYLAFSQAMLQLTTGRGHTVDAHKVLEKVARVFAIDFTMDENDYGDGRKYPNQASGSITQPRVAA